MVQQPLVELVGGDKTKLPLTIEVSKDLLEDSLKIFKIDGGNEGQR